MARSQIRSAQTIALSNLQFEKVIMVNGQAYSTFAAAYAAAAAIATGGNPVAMVVGSGLATDFGDLTLSANWNQDVYITGISAKVSKLGHIDLNGHSGTISMRDVAIDWVIGTVTLKAVNCAFTDDIGSLSGSSVLQLCNLNGSISDLSADGAQLIHCNILSVEPSIDATTARTLFLHQCLLSSEVGLNVTADGNYLVFADLRLP